MIFAAQFEFALPGWVLTVAGFAVLGIVVATIVYFATRPRLSRIGAWASRQSRPMKHALELEQACAGVALRYGVGDVPRPPFWSGFRVVPERIEFWSEKPFRRHERRLYTRNGDEWSRELLFP